MVLTLTEAGLLKTLLTGLASYGGQARRYGLPTDPIIIRRRQPAGEGVANSGGPNA